MTRLHSFNTVGVSSDRVSVVCTATESDKIIFRFECIAAVTNEIQLHSPDAL